MEVQLRHAASQGDLPTVQGILQQPGGVNVNAGDEAGWRGLHFAAAFGNLEIVQEILQVEGVNVDSRANDGLTPLHWAYRAGDTSLPIVQALLEAGADPNAVDNNGYTPLLRYTVHSCCPISAVEALLDGGADPAAQNRDLDTALHVACFGGRLDIVELLIRRQGPECLTATDIVGWTPLDRLGAGEAQSRIPSGVANSIRQHILQACARMIAQRDGLLGLHTVLLNAASIDVVDDEDAEEFELPVGTLNTESLQILLEYVIAAEPGSVVALNSDGLLPLQVAIELDFPASVLYVFLRPYPDILFHTSFPLHHPQGWLQLASEKVSVLFQAAARTLACCNRWLRTN